VSYKQSNTTTPPSTTVTVSLEASVDGLIWHELETTPETTTPSEPKILFTMTWMPFQFVRVKFTDISSPGNTYKISYSAKGV
jgi:hypothetical protein